MNSTDKFKRLKGEIIFEPQILPTSGVVFYLCWWSESRLFLYYLINISEDYPEIPLYVYDIDGNNIALFKERYGEKKSHGMGETFWLKNGEIIGWFNDYRNHKRRIMELFNMLL